MGARFLKISSWPSRQTGTSTILESSTSLPEFHLARSVLPAEVDPFPPEINVSVLVLLEPVLRPSRMEESAASEIPSLALLEPLQEPLLKVNQVELLQLSTLELQVYLYLEQLLVRAMDQVRLLQLLQLSQLHPLSQLLQLQFNPRIVLITLSSMDMSVSVKSDSHH